MPRVIMGPPQPQPRRRQARIEDMGKVTVVEDVLRIRKRLKRAETDGERVRALSELATLHISLEMLEKTLVGRVVNQLRKTGSEEVSEAAQNLVSQWKATAREGMLRRQRQERRFGPRPSL